AALAVRGGWPALYAANRHVIGPDPDVIRPGAVLTVPRAAAPSPAAPGPAGRPAPPPSAPAGSGHRPLPGRTGAPAAAGMPQWLKTVLLAAGLLTGAAFLGGPVLLARRTIVSSRGSQGRRASLRCPAAPGVMPGACPAAWSRWPRRGRGGPGYPRPVLAVGRGRAGTRHHACPASAWRAMSHGCRRL